MLRRRAVGGAQAVLCFNGCDKRKVKQEREKEAKDGAIQR